MIDLLQESVSLSASGMRKLRREVGSGEDGGLLRKLMAESVARRWFLLKRLPCWRTSQRLQASDRYSLVFPSGRRALVSPASGNPYSLDWMARAKCDYLIKVELAEVSGHPAGFFFLHDLRNPDNLLWVPDLSELVTRPMCEFPELSNTPRRFHLSYLIGSLRLLLTGDPAVPPPLETN
jgi:hypothetical protein